MKQIVNVNQSWVIGADNDLLVYIPEDMKFFRSTTKQKTVIMGRKTLESFPGKKPLKGRINIVITRDAARITEDSIGAADLYKVVPDTGVNAELCAELLSALAEGKTSLVVVSSTEAAQSFTQFIPTEDCYVIGGASVYAEMLPMCDTCIVTKNDCEKEGTASYPDLDSLAEWEMTECGEMKEHEGIHFCFTTYKRKA